MERLLELQSRLPINFCLNICVASIHGTITGFATLCTLGFAFVSLAMLLMPFNVFLTGAVSSAILTGIAVCTVVAAVAGTITSLYNEYNEEPTSSSLDTPVEKKFLSLCDEIKNITIGNGNTAFKKKRIGEIIYGEGSKKGLLKNQNLMKYIKNEFITETTQQVDRETTRQVGINQEKINEFCSENVNADHEIIEFLANIYLKTIFIKDDLKEVSELIDNLSQKAPNNDCCSVCRCWPVQKPQPRQIQP